MQGAVCMVLVRGGGCSLRVPRGDWVLWRVERQGTPDRS